MKSIRIRLLTWTIAATCIATLFVSLLTYQLVWDGFTQIRDHELEQIARSIMQYGVEPIGSPPNLQFVSQIWTPSGTLQFSTRPDLDLPRLPAGSHTLPWRNEEWHVHTLETAEATVQVASTVEYREAMFDKISRWLLLPLIALITLLAGLLSMAIRDSLRPLDAVRNRISAQDIELLQPLSTAPLPEEIAPLVGALNTLLGRVDALMTSQRQFIDNAAHELRTPLTAIKLQTQIALASPNEEERGAALTMLHSSVDRATHLVEQLLLLARVEHATAPGLNMEKLAACPLVQAQIVAYSTLAEQRGIDLGVGRCDNATVQGDRHMLSILLGNLIDNALRYAGHQGQIDVEVRREPQQVSFWVIDHGPGIPDSEKPRVFERFRRLASAEISGSGLGLAIAKQIAVLHHGAIELHDTPGGGLSVCLRLPHLPG